MKEDKTPKPASKPVDKKKDEKPIIDATGTVENVQAEEVKQPVTSTTVGSSLVPPKVDSLAATMGPNDGLQYDVVCSTFISTIICSEA